MVDIVVIAILVGLAFYGYQKGLLRMVVSVAASIVTLLVAIVILPYVNDVVKEQTNIYPAVEATLQEQLESYTTEYLEDLEENQQGNFIESLNLPKSIEDMILKNNTEEYYKEQGIQNFSQYMSKMMASIVIRIAIFILTYLALFILLRVVGIVAKIADYLPFIKEANRLSGAALCVLEGLLVIWLICMATTACATTEIGQALNGMIQGSRVLQALYVYNPLTMLF